MYVSSRSAIMGRILSHMPGFRAGKPWHMVLAGAYYLVSVSMMTVSVPLGFMLLSGPFLLLNGYGAMVKYHENKNARALIALFLSAALWGGSLIGFIVDMTNRQDSAPAEMAALTLTATPSIVTADHTLPATEPPPSPSPVGHLLERAIVLGYGEDGVRVQFADESAGDIRLSGIETDETMINQAIAYMEETLPPGSIVYLEQDTDGGYYVWMEEPLNPGKVREKTLNALLALQGYAEANEDSKYAEILTACQEEAQAACVGLWAVALETTAATAPAAASVTTPEPSTPEPAPIPAPSSPEESAQAPAPEDPPADIPDGVYYCGSKNSDVFHLSTCGSASQISPENLVIYSSREDAIHRGKRPCKKCKP